MWLKYTMNLQRERKKLRGLGPHDFSHPSVITSRRRDPNGKIPSMLKCSFVAEVFASRSAAYWLAATQTSRTLQTILITPSRYCTPRCDLDLLSSTEAYEEHLLRHVVRQACKVICYSISIYYIPSFRHNLKRPWNMMLRTQRLTSTLK